MRRWIWSLPFFLTLARPTWGQDVLDPLQSEAALAKSSPAVKSWKASYEDIKETQVTEWNLDGPARVAELLREEGPKIRCLRLAGRDREVLDAVALGKVISGLAVSKCKVVMDADLNAEPVGVRKLRVAFATGEYKDFICYHLNAADPMRDFFGELHREYRPCSGSQLKEVPFAAPPTPVDSEGALTISVAPRKDRTLQPILTAEEMKAQIADESPNAERNVELETLPKAKAIEETDLGAESPLMRAPTTNLQPAPDANAAPAPDWELVVPPVPVVRALPKPVERPAVLRPENGVTNRPVGMPRPTPMPTPKRKIPKATPEPKTQTKPALDEDVEPRRDSHTDRPEERRNGPMEDFHWQEPAVGRAIPVATPRPKKTYFQDLWRPRAR